jgi:dephospho-CoA kinase
VHELLESDELRELLVERLGAGVAAGGRVDRSAVAERVFADPAQRGWLEGVLWPRVGERVSRWKGEVHRMQPPPRAAAVEVPLLFESGMDSVFDSTIAVVAEESVRSERAAARGHAAVDSRAAQQLSQDEKASRADFVVRNDGTLPEFREELSRVLDNIGR